MNYRWMNRGDRIEAPLVKRSGGELQAVDWDEALERTATVLARAAGRPWRSSRRSCRPRRCSSPVSCSTDSTGPAPCKS